MFSKILNSPHSLASENDSEGSASTSKPSTLGYGHRVRPNKRKASIKQESPKKRKRGANNPCITEPSEEPVVDVTRKGHKRKATTKTETPSKKHRGENNDNGSTFFSVNTSRADFEDKYLQLDKLGEGGFGSVYAGNRISDNLPVAIKHIPVADVARRRIVLNGRKYMIPTEVLLLLKVAGPETVGKSAAVSLLDWYDLEQEVLLVMERPVPSVDLLKFLDNNDGPLEEDIAKNVLKQLVDAAVKIHSEGVFHRDIKSENILIQTSSDGPRVRLIDFGCGCMLRKRPYRSFSGTSAYAPPEFYKSGKYEAGPTTVWQLGALLYEMLDGYSQFTTSEFLHKRIQFKNELSQDCLDLLNICLAINPKDRATLEQMQLHPWFT